MSTYSVYNINIDNKLTFPAGPTAGYVLSINADGSTSWVEAQGGGGAGTYDIDTNILNRFTALTPTGDFDLKLVNQPFVGGLITDITGSTVTTKNGFGAIINAITIDANGKIYCGGGFLQYKGVDAVRIIRLNDDGSKDTGFDNSTGFNGVVRAIVIDSNGKIYCGGDFTQYKGVAANRIIRLNADGSKDTGFDNSTGFNNIVNEITIDSNGKIYVGGNFISYKGVTENRIIRLNADGSKDTAFDNSTGFGGVVNSIFEDSNGKIYVGGAFTTYKGVTENRIIRLNADGSKDTGFDNSTGFNNTVNEITIDSNGKIYVGGNFISYKDL
jgi:uncharacterized delta-60 repeat protein